jgi:hypothetical protein
MFDLAGLPGAEQVGPGGFPAVSNCVAARPSGPEPKIKVYLFTASPPCPPGPAGDPACAEN